MEASISGKPPPLSLRPLLNNYFNYFAKSHPFLSKENVSVGVKGPWIRVEDKNVITEVDSKEVGTINKTFSVLVLYITFFLSFYCSK